ncbi:MAG: hypothetical protein ABIG60_05425 [Patescibacteria group bacterium]
MGNDQEKTDLNFKEAIVKTVAFFDMFDYPLTLFEIWQLVPTKCDLMDIISGLTALKAVKPLVEEKDGFYFLIGREEIIKIRLKRYNLTDKKFKKAIFIARIFKIIPWIKLIAVGNIIGSHNLARKSDIDLFIITESKRVWITRFFCVLITKAFGLRPKSGKKRNKICLSFFISEEALNIKELMLVKSLHYKQTLFKELEGYQALPEDNYFYHDIYFIYWLPGLVPIYDTSHIYKKFILANSWLEEFLPNWSANSLNYQRQVKKSNSWFYHDVVDLLLGGLDSRLQEKQINIMPKELINILNQDTRVVATENIIKLHANDRREEYRDKYNKKIYEIFK